MLAHSHPARVQLATDDDDGRNGRSTKVAKGSDEDFGEVGGAGDEMTNFGRLVEKMVGLDADGVFRLVVGFL